MPGRIHHIEWYVEPAQYASLLRRLQCAYSFRLVAGRRHARRSQFGMARPTSDGAALEEAPDCLYRQDVLQQGRILFLITSPETEDRSREKLGKGESDCLSAAYPVLLPPGKRFNTLFNVCFEVDSTATVDAVVDRIQSRDGPHAILMPPTRVGSTLYLAVVKSCCGNILHSVVHKWAASEISDDAMTTSTPSDILPGFTKVSGTCANGVEEVERSRITHLDHVTYVCEAGQSDEILDWYAACFHMRRFRVNASENLSTGVTIHQAEVSIRLKVSQWMSEFMCSERGVEPYEQQLGRDGNTVEDDNFKLVIAEPLRTLDDRDDDSCLDQEGASRTAESETIRVGSNNVGTLTHVEHFLVDHHGPGIQHLGLHSSDVVTTVLQMQADGASFRQPPPTYYQLDDKIREISEAGLQLHELAETGLLIDSETFTDDRSRQSANVPRDGMDLGESARSRQQHQSALLQIFSHPLFGPKEQTFFLEILQRRGRHATGFGSSNITALARSIELMKAQQTVHG